MTLFEYLSVGYSIVLSLTIVRLLGGLPAAVASDRRYWVHVVWISLVLVRSLLIWWSFWSYHEVAAWNFFSFALVLLLPGLLFMMAATLIPDSTSSVGSWQAHFYAVHRRFFTMLALSLLASVALSHLVFGRIQIDGDNAARFRHYGTLHDAKSDSTQPEYGYR